MGENAGGQADTPPNETAQVDPHLCEESHTPFHQWIRSSITGEAKFCYHCEARAADVEGVP